MKKIGQHILIICLAFLSESAFSQSFDDAHPVPVIPFSPVAAGLFNEVNIPVNYYTGTPEVNIPLHVIKTGSLQMPISIKYTASGIRVEQEAGWTGLGWDLITGGAIGRSIVGTPDESIDAGGNGFGYRWTAATMQMPAPGNDTAASGWLTRLTPCQLQKLSQDNTYDLSPDNYFLNFCGNSTKMVFDQNGTPYFSPYKAWKVTGNETNGFTVVIEDGTIYQFMLAEGTSATSETLPSDVSKTITANTTWYLTRVISSDLSDTINLTYQSVSYDPITYNPTESISILESGQPTPPCVAPANGILTSTTTVTREVGGYILTGIQTKEEQVNFYSSMGRLDIPDATKGLPYKLDSIVDNGYTSAGSVVLLKKLIFNYNYTSNSSTGYYTPNCYTQRMQLTSIQEVGASGETGNDYQFSYDNSLPNKDSKAQDTWGFYNKATTNTTLIPSYTDDYGVTWSGANRTTDSTQASLGLLDTIHYPTGGYSAFQYEAHRYATNAPGQRDSLQVSELYEVSTSNTGDINNTNATGTVTIPWTQYVAVSYQIVEEDLKVGDAEVTLVNSAGNSIFATLVIGSSTSTILLPAGTYTLNAIKDPDPQQYAYIRLTFTTNVASPLVGVAAGGARIKRLVQSDGFTTTVKRFSYLTDSITSSGRIVSKPIYGGYQYLPQYNSSPNESCSEEGPGKVGDWIYYTQHSVSTVDMGRTQGSHICYSKVTVFSGENGENGREEYYYNYVPDQGGGTFPYAPVTTMDDFRGQLLQKNVYSAAGNLVEKDVNQYNLAAQNGYPNFKKVFGARASFQRISNTFTLDGCPDLSQYGWEYSSKLYPIFQLWPTLASSTKTVYSSATNDSVVTVTQMNYDTLNLQEASKKTWNSKGDSLLDYYKYPDNFPGTPVYDTMLARNIVNIPLESDHYYDLTVQQKRLTNYQLFSGGPGQLPLPLNQQLQILNNPIETRLEYLNYDVKGKLLSQRKASDASHSYIWDYWNHEPIAEAVNASPSDIAYTSFEAEGTGNWTINGGAVNTTGGFTGNNSYTFTSGATIAATGMNTARLYLLTYWSLNGPLSIAGSSVVTGLTKRGWTFYQHTLPAGSTSLSITGTGITIDELRLYPVDAQMTTYTYTPLVGMTAACSPNNLITYYEYDGLQRLLRIRDMDNNIEKQYAYQYQHPVLFFSAAQSSSFTPVCGTGGSSAPVTFTVADSTFTSTLNQADADQKALSYVTANGQAYANAHSACIYYNTIQIQSFTRSNCASLAIPSTVTDTIAAGLYSSMVDQPTANALAAAALAANGPTYANAQGTCTWYNQTQTGIFRKACGVGGESNGGYSVSVNGGTFSSLISQENADSLANAYLTVLGQNQANTLGSCTYYNTIQTGNYTRSNCACLYTGSVVPDTIAAGLYSSPNSLAEANQLAAAALNAAGPTNANTYGICTNTCLTPANKNINCVCQAGDLEIFSESQTGTGTSEKCTVQWAYYFTDGTYYLGNRTVTTGPCPQP